MLIQIILSLIEDTILSFFIAKMTNLKNIIPFVLINTFLCTLLTSLFNYYQFLTNYLPIFIFLTIMLNLKIFNVKISLNNVLFSLIGPALIILTDLIALLIYSFITDFNIVLLTNTKEYILYASFLAKILLFCSSLVIIYGKNKYKNNLSYKKWGILFPICFLIFTSIYILGNAVVSNSLSNNSIYYLIISQLLLSVLIIILCYLIQKESLNAKQFELNVQKEKYIRENKSMILKLHDEISIIDHNNMYTLLQIKNLLLQKKYNEIFETIDNKIFSLKKYKNIIYTGNPYFDQVLNREINKYSLLKKDIKTICSISNSDFEIEKKDMDFIIDILKYLFSISKSYEPFTIEINDKLNFLNMTFIFYQENNIEQTKLNDLNKTYSSNIIKYHYVTDEEFTYFKIVMEIK